MDFTGPSSRCQQCVRRSILCSLSTFFTNNKTVKPAVFNIAISKRYHYEAIEAREEDKDANISLQSPKIPIEWKTTLENVELPGTGKLALKQFQIINEKTYRNVANKTAGEPQPPLPRVVKHLPKPKVLPPAETPSPDPTHTSTTRIIATRTAPLASRTVPPASRTTPPAHTTDGPDKLKPTRASARQAGKAKPQTACE